MQIVHECELDQTNNEFALRWLGAKIVEVNGAKVGDSEEWKQAIKLIAESFSYPTFRIKSNGEFIETISPEESVKKVDQMLDMIVTNRAADNRKFFAKFGETDAGRRMLNQAFGQIWQTWVETWVGVDLAAGETESYTGKVPLAQAGELPVTEKITNLGIMKPDKNLLNLKCEQELSATNFLGAMNSLNEETGKETGIKGAGPLTNECSIHRLTTLEVHTERQTLRPHWAKQTIQTAITASGEQIGTELEVHEYNFQWDIKNTSERNKQP